MPSIVGNLKINSVDGILNVGDSLYVSPKSTGKTYSGSGSFNTGDFLATNNGASSTNTNDTDMMDANITST